MIFAAQNSHRCSDLSSYILTSFYISLPFFLLPSNIYGTPAMIQNSKNKGFKRQIKKTLSAGGFQSPSPAGDVATVTTLHVRLGNSIRETPIMPYGAVTCDMGSQSLIVFFPTTRLHLFKGDVLLLLDIDLDRSMINTFSNRKVNDTFFFF